MSTFSDSYVSKVLFATPTPARGLETVARRWFEDVPARPVSARATLYARSGSEMAGEARTR
jgi:hypothetical protein